MPISDDIKKEHQKTKDMSFKGKLSYFWDYYKVHTFVAIISVIIIVTVIHDIVTSKDYAFYGVYFNARQTFSAEEQMNTFCDYAGIDTEKYQAMLDNTMYYSTEDMSETTIASSQKFAAMIQTGEIDMVIADEDVFTNYAINEIFYDLRDILPEDILEQYKDRIYYIDRAHIKAANDDEAARQYDFASDYYNELAKKFKDHHDPELMEDPIPLGIYVTDTPVISSSVCYEGKDAVYGIPTNTKRADIAILYLRFLGETTEAASLE